MHCYSVSGRTCPVAAALRRLAALTLLRRVCAAGGFRPARRVIARFQLSAVPATTFWPR